MKKKKKKDDGNFIGWFLAIAIIVGVIQDFVLPHLKMIIIVTVIVLVVIGILSIKLEKETRILDEKALNLKEEILEKINYFKRMNKYMRALFGDENYQKEIKVSAQLVSNFESNKQFEYLVKYFGLVINDETVHLLDELYDCVKDLNDEIDNCENTKTKSMLNKELPYFKMYYVSPMEKTATDYTLDLTPDKIWEISDDVEKVIKKTSTYKYERRKLTKEIRQAVIARDNWTCQICGNSVYKDPNLLLEVDHIIPIAKGGKTEPNNLQTLCFKCNRKKSDNIDFSYLYIDDEDETYEAPF